MTSEVGTVPADRADAGPIRKPPGSRMQRALLAPVQGIVLTFIAGLNIGLVVLQVDAIGLIGLGVGLLLLPFSTAICRAVANWARSLAGKWQGVEIPRPYRPKPKFQRGVMGFAERLRWILSDPATWRDLIWSLLNTVIGFTLALFAAVMVFYGIYGIVISIIWNTLMHTGIDDWYTFVHVQRGARLWSWVPSYAATPLALGTGRDGQLPDHPELLRVARPATRARPLDPRAA